MAKKILIIGTGYMGEEYLKVIKGLGLEATVVGRDEEKAKRVAATYGATGMGGGTKTIDKLKPEDYALAIIASSVDSLKDVTVACLKKGFKTLLVEKPGAMDLAGLQAIEKAMDGQTVRIAYNRRYYASSLKLKEIVGKEGALGCFFDFTDREKDVVYEGNDPRVARRWGLANSSHVIDLAFWLIGLPHQIDCNISGTMPQHPSGTTFTGSGKSERCLFSYFATWTGGGRWDVEISTPTGRYKMSPLEKLTLCKKNQFAWEDVEVDYTDDQEYKPGLKKMVEAMLSGKEENLPTVEEQVAACKTINKMFGYEGDEA